MQRGVATTPCSWIHDVGIGFALDRPALIGSLPVGDVPHDQIYTKFVGNYGKDYRGYSDIKNGNILYWLDPTLSQVYFQPNFVTTAVVSHELRQDPMDVIRPEYPRKVAKPYEWSACRNVDCDSKTYDTLEFRQDLMERQMRSRNESRYEPRWSTQGP